MQDRHFEMIETNGVTLRTVVEGDGPLEIIVSLKDGEDRVRQLQVYTVPGSGGDCLLWPTGRGSYLRDGFVP